MLAKRCYQPSFLCPRDKRESRRHSEPPIFLCLSSPIVKFRFSSPPPPPEFLSIMNFTLESYCSYSVLCLCTFLLLEHLFSDFFLHSTFKSEPMLLLLEAFHESQWVNAPPLLCSYSTFWTHLQRSTHITQHCRAQLSTFLTASPLVLEFLQRD